MNKKICILATSITYAQKGKQLLSKMGISSHISRFHERMGFRGCAHCIVVDSKYRSAAINAFDSAGVSYTDILAWE